MIRCSTSSVMCLRSVLVWPAYQDLSLLSGVRSGKRLALLNAEIMIHQPSGGAQGQASEIQIAAEHILKTRRKLNEILAANTGQTLETIARDTDRDNFMSAEEAKAYGLIDEVITSR